MRLDLLPLGIAGVLGGTACAAYMGNFDFLSSCIALLFVVVVQLTSNLLHRYIDEARHYGENKAEGLRSTSPISLKQLLREASFGMALVSLMLGLAVMVLTGWWFAGVLVIVAALMYFYAAAPRPLSRSAFSPLIFFFVFGPLCVATTCFIQTAHLEPKDVWVEEMIPTIWMSICIGMFAVNALIADQFDIHQTDTETARSRTIVRLMGVSGARAFYIINGFVGACAIWPFFDDIELSTRLPLLIVPVICLIINTALGLRITKAEPQGKRAPLVRLTAQNMLLFAVGLLIYCLILGWNLEAMHARAYFG